MIDPCLSIPEVDAFNDLTEQGFAPTRLCLPALSGCQTLRLCEPKDLAAIVLFGSDAMVAEHRDWQCELVEWLHPVLTRHRVPCLAICYGHQLIAHMFGAPVGPREGGKALGPRSMRVQSSSRLLPGMPEDAWTLYVAHSQEVKALPEGFELLASSSGCSIEAVEHRELPILGVQAHPEATPAFGRHQGLALDGESTRFGQALVQSFLVWSLQRPKSSISL